MYQKTITITAEQLFKDGMESAKLLKCRH